MPASDLIRWGGLAAMGGGVLFIVYSLLGVATGKGEESGPLDLLAILAYVLLVVGLVGFHTLQQRNYGRIGRAGLYTTIAAFLLWEVLLLTGLLGVGEALPEWLVAVGVLGTLVGEVLYGAATLQARVLPRFWGGPSRGLLNYMGWTSLAGAGVRPLVAQWCSCRTALAREVS